jgi:hypothetical protein
MSITLTDHIFPILVLGVTITFSFILYPPKEFKIFPLGLYLLSWKIPNPINLISSQFDYVERIVWGGGGKEGHMRNI